MSKQTHLYDLEVELNNIAPVVLRCLWLCQLPIQVCQQCVVDVIHMQPHPAVGVECRCAGDIQAGAASGGIPGAE
jgi:hypothetical protein